MEINAVWTIARQELVINIRNKWTLVFATAFGVLVLAISFFGLITAGNVGFQGFVRTSASLLNLVLYIVPLVALMMGTLSFTSDKSASELLFAQPVTRTEILVGKLAGLFGSILIATLIGFGLAGIIIAARAGSFQALRYVIFVSLSLALALTFLCLSAAVSVVCGRKAMAFGAAIFIWFFLVLFYDLLVMGGSLLLQERTANKVLFLSLLGNPVDIVRVASLIALDGTEIFGPAGAALVRFWGGGTASIVFLLGILFLWMLLPFLVARYVLRRQDI